MLRNTLRWASRASVRAPRMAARTGTFSNSVRFASTEASSVQDNAQAAPSSGSETKSRPKFDYKGAVEKAVTEFKPLFKNSVETSEPSDSLMMLSEFYDSLAAKHSERLVASLMRTILRPELFLLIKKLTETPVLSADPAKIIKSYIQYEITTPELSYLVLESLLDKLDYASALSVYAGLKNSYSKEGLDRAVKLQTYGYAAYIGYVVQNNLSPDLQQTGQLFTISPRQDFVLQTLKKGAKDDFSKMEQVLVELEFGRIDLKDPSLYLEMRESVDKSNFQKFFSIALRCRRIAEFKKEKLPEVFYVSLMQIHARLRNVDEVIKTWNSMEKDGVPRGIESWNALLPALGLAGEFSLRPKKIEAFFNEMKNRSDLKLNSGTYVSLINAYGNSKMSDKVKEVYETVLKEKNVPITADIHEAFLVHYSRQNTKEAFAIYKKLLDEGFYPSVKVLNTFMRQYGRMGQVEVANEILDLFQSLNIQPDAATYSIVLSMLVKLCSKAGMKFDVEMIKNLTSEMEKNGLQLTPFNISAMINGLMRSPEDARIARVVFDQFKSEFQYNASMYSTMIKGEFGLGQSQNAIKYFQSYIKHQTPSIQMLNYMISLLCKLNRVQQAYEEYYLPYRKNDFSHSIMLKGALDAGEDGKDVVEGVLKELAGAELASKYLKQTLREIKGVSQEGNAVIQRLAGEITV